MKLLRSLQLRIFGITTLVLTGWSVFFYFTMMHEVNDETDDALDDYAETIIIRALAGEQLPSKDNGSNNQYFLREVTQAYADSKAPISYADSMVYITQRSKREPARVLTYIFPDDHGCYYELTVSTPTIEKADLKRSIFVWMFILYLVLLVFLISLTTWMVRGYMRSMERAADQQKQFIGNASHEMQTPLAICRGRIEMLMEDDSMGEQQLEELARTHQTLERISRLNKSLLLLTKIENHQFADRQEVHVNSLLKNYLSDYAEVYGHRHIRLTLTELSSFKIRINESLASILLTNLLKNAYVHNVDGGEIQIILTESELRIINTAAIARPLDARRIFERFYHDPDKEGSTGLGLSIVTSICSSQGLGISYAYDQGRHAFTVRKGKV